MTQTLIVDDEEPIRRLLGQILENDGYECTLAANAAEAREYLKAQNFQVLLSDINMPGESGLDLIRYVLAEYQDTATLVVSVVDDPLVAEEALDLGVYGFIVKPFHPKGVLINVRNALHRRELETDNRAYREKLEQMVSERTSAVRKSNEELEQTLARLKETQVQMIQAEKMASIGQLAAGIAHEINTPTQYVGDNTRFVQDAFVDLERLLEKYDRLLKGVKDHMLTDDLIQEVEAVVQEADLTYLLEEIPKAIEQTLEGVERVSKIVRAMKEFSHPGVEEKTSVDINKSLESTITVARNEWKYVAEMVTDFDPSLPLVPCLPGELNQVFLNMIINAAHSIADLVGEGSEAKGTITVSTHRNGSQAEIRIGDTGTGIPEEIKSKIFDPFFTTKDVGKGTGQGLAIAHSVIVDKHDGTVSFETAPGKGTTFIIQLPISE